MADRITYHCENCGHNWHPRKDAVPEVCPRCHSKYWRIGPQRASRPDQLQNAALRRLATAGELKRIPVSDEKRQAAYAKMGVFQPADEENFVLGTTNAGPWHESEIASELPRVALLDLMGFNRETDTMFRVNELENNGICLSGDDIFPGDVIHFRRGLQPATGDIVLVEGHDTQGRWFVTCKHWHQRGLNLEGRPIIELRPSNPRCKVIRLFPANVLEISVALSVTKMALHKRGRRGIR